MVVHLGLSPLPLARLNLFDINEFGDEAPQFTILLLEIFLVLRTNWLIVGYIILRPEEDFVLLNLINSGFLNKHVSALYFDLVHVASNEVGIMATFVLRCFVGITATLDLAVAETI